MVYAVIDTNVLVSALFAVHSDSATVIIRDKVADEMMRAIIKDKELAALRRAADALQLAA